MLSVIGYRLSVIGIYKKTDTNDAPKGSNKIDVNPLHLITNNE